MKKLNLGEYTKIKTGKLDANASSINGKYPFFTCSSEVLKIDYYDYDCECVLVAGNGDLNVKYYNGKFNAYQRTYIIESSDTEVLNTKYLYYLIDSKIEQLRNASIGGVIKYIRLNNLTDIKFEKRNLEEQLHIVKELDKVKEIIDIRRKQLLEADKFIDCLFVKMFGNPNQNDKNFEKIKLKDCVTRIENGKSFVCENFKREGTYPRMLKLSAVTYGEFIEEENKALIDSEMFINSVEVKKGDLLFTRKNTPELVGMSAYVYETLPNLMLPDLIFRFVTLENCNKLFLSKLINHKLFRKNITSIANGSAKSMSNISKEKLMNLEIILPPIELQEKFSNIVEKTRKQKINIKKELDNAIKLRDSLMNKYFN